MRNIVKASVVVLTKQVLSSYIPSSSKSSDFEACYKGAADHDIFLIKKGFMEINVSDLKKYLPKKGDVAVFERFKGDKKYHGWGHIQMYNGKKWLSDFEQRDFWAGSDYRNSKPNFKIYRW